MIRRWLPWIITIAFLWLVASRFTEINQLWQTLQAGRLLWVLAAAVLQVLYYVVFSASYQAAFASVGVTSHLLELIPVTLGAIFVNVVAPTAGTAGAAVFVDDLTKRDQPGARVAAGVLLQLIVDFSMITLILVVGLVYLSLQGDLQIYEVIGAIILFLITGGLSSLFVLALWRPALLLRVLDWARGTWNHILGSMRNSLILADDWAERNSKDFIEAANAVAGHPWKLARVALVALGFHIVDISTLYVLFLAFHYQITPGPLISGYAMGILFWIVSITPQGIGVVEGVMTLVFSSLGVPPAIAATATLSFRGLSFWLPLTLGFYFLNQQQNPDTNFHTLVDHWSVRLAALLTALMGVINVLSAILPSLASRVTRYRGFAALEVERGGRLTAAIAGFALLLLAISLWRRKRVALTAAIVALLVSTVSHILKGPDYEEALLSLGIALLLYLLRHHFHARSDPPSIRRGLLVLIAAGSFTLFYGVTGFYLLDHHYSVNFSLGSALRQTVVMFTEFYNPGLHPITGYGRFFADSIYFVGASTFGYAAILLMQPVLLRHPANLTEREWAERIVGAHGKTSLARLALLPDKTYYFSPGGSLVAYMLKNRVAVALGDPIGPEDDLQPTIAGFQELCAQNDWIPAFYETRPETLDIYHKAGYKSTPVGQEAIVDLSTFTLQGKEGKPLRYVLRHFQEMGYSVEFYQPPIPKQLIDELQSISDEWLSMVHGAEKRFSLGWFEEDYIRDSLIATVQTSEGLITAFANLLPEYQCNELSIDLMRRRRDVESGTMDFLFVSIFQWAAKQGYDSFNMGLSALAGVGENPKDPASERVLHFVYENIGQFYNFKGLHSFKAKFRPAWSPRYLIYPSLANLAQVWMAVVAANSGEEEFPWAYFRK